MYGRIRFHDSERAKANLAQLLAWSIGHFEYIEEFTQREYNGKRMPVRVYTTIGLKDQAQLALTHASRFVDFYSEVKPAMS